MKNSPITWSARIIGALLFLASLALIATFGLKYSILEFGSAPERLQLLWNQDVAALKASGKLPAGWSSIREIQLIPTTDNAKLWLKKVQVPIQLKSDGAYKLEVMVVSWDEGKDVGAIVQYNLVELKTNNMVWELGRTFVLSGNEVSSKRQ